MKRIEEREKESREFRLENWIMHPNSELKMGAKRRRPGEREGEGRKEKEKRKKEKELMKKKDGYLS